MQFKFKLLAAAAALAMSSAPAFATIDVSTNPSLLFVAYDGSGNTADTYVRILGSLNSINGTSNASFAAPPASIFTTQFAGVAASNIYWNVFALDNTSPSLYLTGNLALQQAQGAASGGSFGVSSIAGILMGGLGSIPQLDLASNGYAKPNGEYTGAANSSDQTNAIQIANNFSGGFTTSGHGVGSSQNFLYIDPDGNGSQLYTNAALSAFDTNAKGGYFTLTDAAGDVTWTAVAVVSAVPLPAGALLFGPGLLAMFGIGRRNKKS